MFLDFIRVARHARQAEFSPELSHIEDLIDQFGKNTGHRISIQGTEPECGKIYLQVLVNGGTTGPDLEQAENFNGELGSFLTQHFAGSVECHISSRCGIHRTVITISH